jgi:hypothetical protein
VRYQTAGELGRDLAQYLSGQQTAVRQPEPAPLPVKAPGLNITAISLAVIALCAVVAAVWLVARKSGVQSNVTPPAAAQVAIAAPTTAPSAPVAIATTLTAAGLPENYVVGIFAGTGHLEGNALALTPGKLPATIYFGPTIIADYDMSFDAMVNDSSNKKGFRAIIHAAMHNVCLYWIAAEGNTVISLYSRFDGVMTRLQAEQFRMEPNQWYNVKVEARGPEIRCFLDGHEHFDIKETRFTSGRVGISSSDPGARFRNIKVTAPDGSIIWQGPPDLSHLPPEQIDPPGK